MLILLFVLIHSVYIYLVS